MRSKGKEKGKKRERRMESEALAETGKNRQTPQPGIEPGPLSKRVFFFFSKTKQLVYVSVCLTVTMNTLSDMIIIS